MGSFASVASVVLIIFGFGVLIFVHELGHFLAAKWAGIRTEGFAVGMGPVMCSWRKGIGFTLGSTHRRVVARAGKPASELSDAELAEHGLGETEYSLRWLPIGGFVKMLGQEDLNPEAVSADPRSYNVCPIGKRMVVVSAGVIMNVLLALALFVAAFLVGVRFEAPFIGNVSLTLPGGVTMPDNAAELGIEEAGLRPGDEVTKIDGKPARTFADIQIATAMSRPGEPITLEVRRRDVPEPLRFTLVPRQGIDGGLLSIGIEPGQSNRLLGGAAAASVDEILDGLGLAEAGVRAGMELTAANGAPIGSFGEFVRAVDASGGGSVLTRWTALDEHGAPAGEPVTASLDVTPRYADLAQKAEDGAAVVDPGLLGFSPLVQLRRVLERSPNLDRLEPGDVILRAGALDFPRESQFKRTVRANAGGEIALRVRRGDREIDVTATVDGDGRLGVWIKPFEDRAVTAAVVDTVFEFDTQATRATPAAGVNPMAGSAIESVGGVPVTDWTSFRSALRSGTADALARGTGATLSLSLRAPTPDAPVEDAQLDIGADDVAAVHRLGWQAGLESVLFEEIYTTLSANGNPFTAIAMGFRETHKMITMTYLTIDRLFRGSVGVEQLRGPVGIIDLGAKILPKGFMYFLFFLGLISVNLAVINFLPLPIVDGGLFLFLIYEKLKGRPPSVQFQNVATVVGLCLIGTIFLVTFYNDIMRLL